VTRRLGKLEDETHLAHEIIKVSVEWFRPEMPADDLEDRPFHKKYSINGAETDTILAIPAKLATTGNARVHNVISNEGIGLQLESLVNGASY
jgi:hypothetical protein